MTFTPGPPGSHGIPVIGVADVPDPLPEDTTLVDVREQDEWDAGHAPDAIHVPLGELPARVHELGDGPTLLVCKGGGRSLRAAMWLTGQGYEATNVDGGMLDWERAGRPMVSENGQDPTVV